jgi:hypothetical protein
MACNMYCSIVSCAILLLFHTIVSSITSVQYCYYFIQLYPLSHLCNTVTISYNCILYHICAILLLFHTIVSSITSVLLLFHTIVSSITSVLLLFHTIVSSITSVLLLFHTIVSSITSVLLLFHTIVSSITSVLFYYFIQLYPLSHLCNIVTISYNCILYHICTVTISYALHESGNRKAIY